MGMSLSWADQVECDGCTDGRLTQPARDPRLVLAVSLNLPRIAVLSGKAVVGVGAGGVGRSRLATRRRGRSWRNLIETNTRVGAALLRPGQLLCDGTTMFCGRDLTG